MARKVLKYTLWIAAPIIGLLLYTQFAGMPIFKAPQTSYVLTFNEKTPLRAVVVSEGKDLARGLSGVERLPPTEGMLFIFPTDDYHGIWMKDMRFPLDIIWVDRDGVITDIAKNVQPYTYPTEFRPTRPARFVVEVNAYFTDSFAIKAGDRVHIPDDAFPE